MNEINNGFKNLESRISYLIEKIKHHPGEMEAYETFIMQHNDKIDGVKSKIDNLGIYLDVIQKFKLGKYNKKKNLITNVINRSLDSIFPDMGMFFEISQSRTGKNFFDLILYKNGKEIARNEKLITSNGGSVLTTISVFLKIMFGYLQNKHTLYIFDEPFNQVEHKYRDDISLYIRDLVESYDMTILIVTHDENIISHAHNKVFLGSSTNKEGISSLKVNKIEATIPEEEIKVMDRYEVEIENFQSIKSIKVPFFGFTTIRGANNIGKSATLRAINSVLFNTFEKHYHRIGERKCKIRFQKTTPEGKVKWVEVEHVLNSKSRYAFDDSVTLYGKKGAEEEIFRKLEDFNIKQMDTSKMTAVQKKDVKEFYFSSQFKPLFLVGETQIHVNKFLDSTFGIEHINEAEKKYKDEIRTENDSLKRYEILITSKKEEKEQSIESFERNKLDLVRNYLDYERETETDETLNSKKRELEKKKIVAKLNMIKGNFDFDEILSSYPDTSLMLERIVTLKNYITLVEFLPLIDDTNNKMMEKEQDLKKKRVKISVIKRYQAVLRGIEKLRDFDRDMKVKIEKLHDLNEKINGINRCKYCGSPLN
jgi:energy-coupling factor transporter ATP-binding protein EcfA2